MRIIEPGLTISMDFEVCLSFDKPLKVIEKDDEELKASLRQVCYEAMKNYLLGKDLQ